MNTYTTIKSLSQTYTINNIDYTNVWRQEDVYKSTSDHTVDIILIIGCVALGIALIVHNRRIHADEKEIEIRKVMNRKN
jgi:hypothetical protein